MPFSAYIFTPIKVLVRSSSPRVSSDLKWSKCMMSRKKAILALLINSVGFSSVWEVWGHTALKYQSILFFFISFLHSIFQIHIKKNIILYVQVYAYTVSLVTNSSFNERCLQVKYKEASIAEYFISLHFKW